MPEIQENPYSTAPIGEDAAQEKQVVPATWGDLILYLVGCVGGYFLLSLGSLVIFGELNLTVMFLTTLLNFLCFAGGVYLFGVWRGKLSWEGIGLLPPKSFWLSALGGAALAVVVNIFRFGVMLVLVIFAGVELDSLAGRQEFLLTGLDTWQGALLSLVGIGVLVPISEELFFRGLLYGWFRQKTPMWAAVLITSLMFGLAHYDSWIVIVSSFIMGIALALAYEYSKSIWVSIFMHIVTNSGSVLLMVFFIWIEKVFLG